MNGTFNNSCQCVCAPGWKGTDCNTQDCGAVECGASYNFMLAGDPTLCMKSEGGQNYFNYHELSDNCGANGSSSSKFKFIRSKFSPDSYFIQANSDPTLFLYVSSTSSDTRPRWQNSCNLNTDNKLCQWKLVSSGSGKYQIVSADNPEYAMMVELADENEIIRINRRCVATDGLCNWTLAKL